MIVVEANLKSAIHESRNETLCRVEIANVSGSGARRDYRVRLYSRGAKGRLIREAMIRNWPSNQWPAWRLVQEAFKSLGEL